MTTYFNSKPNNITSNCLIVEFKFRAENQLRKIKISEMIPIKTNPVQTTI